MDESIIYIVAINIDLLKLKFFCGYSASFGGLGRLLANNWVLLRSRGDGQRLTLYRIELFSYLGLLVSDAHGLTSIFCARVSWFSLRQMHAHNDRLGPFIANIALEVFDWLHQGVIGRRLINSLQERLRSTSGTRPFGGAHRAFQVLGVFVICVGIKSLQRRSLSRQLRPEYKRLFYVSWIRVCLRLNSILIWLLEGTECWVVVVSANFFILTQDAFTQIHLLLLKSGWRNWFSIVITQQIHGLNLWVIVLFGIHPSSVSLRSRLVRIINLEYLASRFLLFLHQFNRFRVKCFIEVLEMSLRGSRRILRIIRMIPTEYKFNRGLVTWLLWRWNDRFIQTLRYLNSFWTQIQIIKISVIPGLLLVNLYGPLKFLLFIQIIVAAFGVVTMGWESRSGCAIWTLLDDWAFSVVGWCGVWLNNRRNSVFTWSLGVFCNFLVNKAIAHHLLNFDSSRHVRILFGRLHESRSLRIKFWVVDFW